MLPYRLQRGGEREGTEMKTKALGWALLAFFILSWAGQALTQWREFFAEQIAHGEVPNIGDFSWVFLSRTFENWQSEFLQLFAMVVLTTYLIYEGSPQSKDGSERMEAKIDRIEQALERIARTDRRSS